MTSPHQSIIEAIRAWDPVKGPASWPAAHFEALARQVFAHQYTQNPTYRTFCNRRAITAENLPGIDEIPAVPTDAFKLLDLFTGARPDHTFRTSGTTTERRGAHHFATLDVYRASLHPSFIRFCNPERQTFRMLILAPRAEDLPDSSLSFMLSELFARWDDGQGAFFVTPQDDAHLRLDPDAFSRALDQAEADGIPTMVMGTAFAFAEFFERIDNTWRLPEGSRLMETGGFKGRTRTLSRDELYDAFTTRLAIPRQEVISEYSMTELSSQTYTCAPDYRFFAPPWLKIQIVDPITLKPTVAPGQPGLIRFIDLANIDSVLAIQTSDRGLCFDDGSLQLLGRAPDADLRGCSLTIEEIITSK